MIYYLFKSKLFKKVNILTLNSRKYCKVCHAVVPSSII